MRQKALWRHTSDGCLAIDNNPAERSQYHAKSDS
ncbi:hypothetical protein [Rhizorhabdus dicambivorans]